MSTGKSLMIGGSTSIHKKNNHYTGDLSAIIIQKLTTMGTAEKNALHENGINRKLGTENQTNY